MKNQLKTIVGGDSFSAQLKRCLPRDLKPEVLQRIALTTINKDSKLGECTPESICSCLLDLAAAGLVPDGRKAHLIPRGGQCTLLIDYKGYVELLYRSDMVTRVRAELVHENDIFDHDRGTVIRHTWNLGEDRGELVGVYAEVDMREGSVCQIMSISEVEEIRDNFAQGTRRPDSPWNTRFGEMAKKTALRQLTKWLPLQAETSEAIARDGAETIDVQAETVPGGKYRSKPKQIDAPAEPAPTSPPTSPPTSRPSNAPAIKSVDHGDDESPWGSEAPDEDLKPTEPEPEPGLII